MAHERDHYFKRLTADGAKVYGYDPVIGMDYFDCPTCDTIVLFNRQLSDREVNQLMANKFPCTPKK